MKGDGNVRRYRRWWTEFPGAMLLMHWATVGGAIVVALMVTRPLTGIIGVVAFLLITTALVPLARILDEIAFQKHP